MMQDSKSSNLSDEDASIWSNKSPQVPEYRSHEGFHDSINIQVFSSAQSVWKVLPGLWQIWICATVGSCDRLDTWDRYFGKSSNLCKPKSCTKGFPRSVEEPGEKMVKPTDEHNNKIKTNLQRAKSLTCSAHSQIMRPTEMCFLSWQSNLVWSTLGVKHTKLWAKWEMDKPKLLNGWLHHQTLQLNRPFVSPGHGINV